jgi:hypothetical protein
MGTTCNHQHFIFSIVNIGNVSWFLRKVFVDCIDTNSELTIEIGSKTVNFIFVVDKKCMRISTFYFFERDV